MEEGGGCFERTGRGSGSTFFVEKGLSKVAQVSK